MPGIRINKPHLQKSAVTEYLEQKKSVKDKSFHDSFVVSFKHLSKDQGQGIYIWEQDSRLSQVIEVLSGYCQRPLEEQCDGKKFVKYGGFPAKSKYTHPKDVPEDAHWARIHVDGTHVIAGHIWENTFYVVFLDHDHTFYISEKKNT